MIYLSIQIYFELFRNSSQREEQKRIAEEQLKKAQFVDHSFQVTNIYNFFQSYEIFFISISIAYILEVFPKSIGHKGVSEISIVKD